MRKTLIVWGIASFVLCGTANAQSLSTSSGAKSSTQAKTMKASIHQFQVESINGGTFDFRELAGKKVMIVNTASECGFTPQYKELQALYEKYQGRLVIIGFPTNDFGGQEPGSNREIANFCEVNYGVSFPMMAKITVKGEQMHPVYQFLTQRAKNGLKNSKVEWNFQKYLLNPKGELVEVLASDVKPNDPQIISWIESK
ncbi:glutathione peroxidase [Flavobacterium caeni]|uniref:Glutathione peroxidase n=1 Tax=Flavobacterium caeni TaxID=490189 RepID=A0A1G5BP61_9FLAO|nr:glutathione peroxidase [Flavobacterium caeni]SCX91995.1 glutathione peroxidase [Flavobacterium caeni]